MRRYLSTISLDNFSTYAVAETPKPKFTSISIIRFRDIPHFRILPFTPVLKFQSAIFFNLADYQEM